VIAKPIFFMKLIFILLFHLSLFTSGKRPKDITAEEMTILDCSSPESATKDSSRLRIINNSSLRHLPLVLRDLSVALSESTFEQEGLVNENGFDIDLHDAVCKSFDTSATVIYRPDDSIFHLKLNKYNKQASDRALAATLIHEIMHCILIDIANRARLHDEKALSIIERFNQKIQNPFGYSGNDFFNLMNRGGEGQHELMYQLFYQNMVLLLEEFAQIHKPVFWRHEDAEFLMWSGLQLTSGFQKLNLEEKRQIEFTILKAKGIAVSLLDYE
jgi:hypothetical protein